VAGVAVEEKAPEAVEETVADDAAPASHLLRRTVLGGIFGVVVGGGGYLVSAGVLPGRTPLLRAAGLGEADAPLPRLRSGEVRLATFTSQARGGKPTEYLLALPPRTSYDELKAPGAEPLPVCVLLHGRGDSARSLVEVGYDRFLASAVTAGTPPFAIAAIDGGDRYWHARKAGDDTGRMIVDELLPRLARAGLRAEPRDRIALLGYSMGGYGALLLATQLQKARVAAVVAESPAIWTSFADAAPGAFDDDADFRKYDVFARRGGLAGIPLKIDCGIADPFYRTARELADSISPHPAGSFGRGAHDDGYWRSVAASSLAFVGQALARAGDGTPT
jgi:S-formylglutathione hydrolase FrmB